MDHFQKLSPFREDIRPQPTTFNDNDAATNL